MKGKSHFKHIAAAIVTVGLSLAGSSWAQQEIKLTYCSGQAPIFPFNQLIGKVFIPTANAELAKSGKNKIVWNEAYGGTLAKIGGELEAVEQGICDMGNVGVVFHAAKIPLQNVTSVVPFGSTDTRVISKVMNELNRNHPAMRGAWDKQNQVFLTGIPVDDYGLVSNYPVNKFEDVAGKKIASSPFPLAWIKGSGATGVASGLPSYYNDMKSGLYSGVLVFITGALPIKLFEVGPYFNQTGMGATFPGSMTVNKQRWEQIGPEVQAALRVAGDAYLVAYLNDLQGRLATSADAWRAAGGKMVLLSDAEKARWAKAIDNPVKAWLAQTDKTGLPGREVLKAYMDAMRAEGVKYPRDWDQE